MTRTLKNKCSKMPTCLDPEYRAQNRAVHGLLWTIKPDDEQALDRYEGVAGGHYGKKAEAVHADDGSEPVEP